MEFSINAYEDPLYIKQNSEHLAREKNEKAYVDKIVW